MSVPGCSLWIAPPRHRTPSPSRWRREEEEKDVEEERRSSEQTGPP